MMQVIPAIDIRDGKCVRLKQGDPEKQTQYDVSPLSIAKNFYQSGATKIHLVDLDGALDEATQNERIICRIVEELTIPIELGGGIRSLERMAFWFERGVSQVIMGTLAVRHPELVREAVKQFGSEQLIVGIDAKDGNVATHGWQSVSDIPALVFAQKNVVVGIKRFIYTDIRTDGMFTGPNWSAISNFAQSVPAKLTASGGVRNIEDVKTLKRMGLENLDSVIVGKAIYENRLDLNEAIRVGKGEEQLC